jgi:hypothetical protein
MNNNRIADFIDEESPPAPPFSAGAFMVCPLPVAASGPWVQQFYAAAFEQARQATEARRPHLLDLDCWN